MFSLSQILKRRKIDSGFKNVKSLSKTSGNLLIVQGKFSRRKEIKFEDKFTAQTWTVDHGGSVISRPSKH